jgi:hypothetical protein
MASFAGKLPTIAKAGALRQMLETLPEPGVTPKDLNSIPRLLPNEVAFFPPPVWCVIVLAHCVSATGDFVELAVGRTWVKSEEAPTLGVGAANLWSRPSKNWRGTPNGPEAYHWA